MYLVFLLLTFKDVIASWPHLILVLHKLGDDRCSSFRTTCVVHILIVAKMKYFLSILSRVFSMPMSSNSKWVVFFFFFSFFYIIFIIVVIVTIFIIVLLNDSVMLFGAAVNILRGNQFADNVQTFLAQIFELKQFYPSLVLSWNNFCPSTGGLFSLNCKFSPQIWSNIQCQKHF